MSVFEAAVPDLQWIGTEWRGTCLSCRNPTLRLLMLGPDEIEPTCIHCQPVQILDSVRAALGVTKNGSRPAAPETSVVASCNIRANEAEREPPKELEPEALYGIPGEVVIAIEPHTESHPAAILASFLIGAGCLIGRGPHVYRDGARHAGNEFGCLVGLTAKGRKGTGTRRSFEVFSQTISQYDIFDDMSCEKQAGPTWQEVILTGLGSGEGLVSSLVEALKEGETSPRRLILEEEFSKPLKVMAREGSTLSETLRSAWDGGILANRTKGKALVAETSHVSILAHVTESELRQEMSSTSLVNGFANRFLWFCTQRVRSLPFGGGEAPLARVVLRFRHALEFAKTLRRMEFSADAARLWDEGGIYELLVERPAGLLGSVTSRAEAHVTRLSLLYAVLDGSSEIQVPHLLAALAVWDYSEKSCEYIFGRSSGDDYADSIDEMLQEAHPGYLTRTEIRDKFGRNAPPGRIPKALAMLEKEGKAERATLKTKGHPLECWQSAQSRNARQNDQSPLLRARALVGTKGETK